jgi:hypothetical protein
LHSHDQARDVFSGIRLSCNDLRRRARGVGVPEAHGEVRALAGGQPFAAYPLHPAACARLIGDLAVFTVETSGPALAKSLRDAGFETRWVRPPDAVGDLAPGEVVMELSVITGSQLLPGGLRAEATSTLQMRRSVLDQYLIELVDQDTWIEGLSAGVLAGGSA